MIRITSGTAKNKKLKVPNDGDFRSVQEKAKLAVFSILGDHILGSKCLDLYAGSGNIGIEAVSRGANSCDFVDKNKEAIEIIKENLNNCSLTDKAQVFRADAVKYVANTPETYDFIFVDPYYDDISHTYLLQNLAEILNITGYLVFFHGSNLDLEKLITKTNLEIKTQRKFGKSYFTIMSAEKES